MMTLAEAVDSFIAAHKDGKIDVDYIIDWYGSVENYMLSESAAQDVGVSYIEVAAHESIDGTPKIIEWENEE
jgi:hypothetical protein